MNDSSLLRPGESVWRRERATRLAFLVDGDAYFAAFAGALSRARHSVFVAAWEIDDHISLDPSGRRRGQPARLGDALRARLAACRSLRVRVLAWDFAMLYVAERGLEPLFRLRFSHVRRLDFRLDSCHPTGASHHQKLVVVDDAVAFVGGIDPAPQRWDTPAHRKDEPARTDPDGRPSKPFHDVQAMVEGPPARSLGELFRERWRCATGRELPPPATPAAAAASTPWPEEVKADLADAWVGIARTRAAHEGLPEVREVERLYLDSIAAASRSIYLENQYLTSVQVTHALARRLSEVDGPDVVIVLPRRCLGWLEQRTVGLVRRRQLDELRRADRHHRLRVVYPHVPGIENGVFVHAKVAVVDDRLARVGSANLSNRSMGFDSECDLAVEAGGNGEALGIRAFRDRLLAEHLGCGPDEVERAIEDAGGSLAAAVDRLSDHDGRTLRPVDAGSWDGEWEAALDLGQALADPESPEEPERLAETLLARDVPRATRIAWLRAAAIGALLVGLGALVRLTPLGHSLSLEAVEAWLAAWLASPLAPLGVVAVYVGASLVFVPVTLLIVATALALPAPEALACALFGGIAAAVSGFGLGRVLGRDLVRRVAGKQLNPVSLRLGRRGVLSVAAVRLVPFAPFTVVNLVAGVSRVTLRDFVLGTVAGILPGALVIVLLEASLEKLVRSPGLGTALGVVLVVGAALLVFAVARRLRPGSGA